MPEYHEATKSLKIEITKAKRNYKTELENKMSANKLGSAWSSMKIITGTQQQKSRRGQCLEGYVSDMDFVNDLNCFYARFDT